jgi:hypothetical protein
MLWKWRILNKCLEIRSELKKVDKSLRNKKKVEKFNLKTLEVRSKVEKLDKVN